MATTINADNGVSSGSAGLKQTADNSGSLVLQTNGTTAVTISTGQVATFANPASGAVKKTTRQIFTSGSSATYTTPSGCTQLRVLIVGAGGGGGGGGNYGGSGATSGGTGGTTTFNSITAIGGNGGGAGMGGPAAGGTGGSNGTATNPVRTKGASGTQAISGVINYIAGSEVYTQARGGAGACGYGGGYGAGGNGGGVSDTGSGSTGGSFGGVGGGAGEMVDFYINSPAASYTYTVGSGGTAGGAGSYNGGAGIVGAGGLIIVDEYYY